jgi:hypothetical protein
MMAVTAEAVESEEEREQPEREEPEKETLRMCRSRGRLERRHFWLKLCPSTCMVGGLCVYKVYSVVIVGLVG